MSKSLNIAILAFPGCQVLDITGPAMVFEAGNGASRKAHYNVHILSSKGGRIQTNSAVALVTKPLRELPPRMIDTLLIAGGDLPGLRMLVADRSVRKWVLQASTKARRFGSVCTGTFALAHFDLLRGKRVATHWSVCSELAELCPEAHVDANALFVNDGRLWTSAGVTTGIDMSLAMVASDLGDTRRQCHRQTPRSVCATSGIPISVQPGVECPKSCGGAVRGPDRLDSRKSGWAVGSAEARRARFDVGAHVPEKFHLQHRRAAGTLCRNLAARSDSRLSGGGPVTQADRRESRLSNRRPTIEGF